MLMDLELHLLELQFKMWTHLKKTIQGELLSNWEWDAPEVFSQPAICGFKGENNECQYYYYDKNGMNNIEYWVTLIDSNNTNYTPPRVNFRTKPHPTREGGGL